MLTPRTRGNRWLSVNKGSFKSRVKRVAINVNFAVKKWGEITMEVPKGYHASPRPLLFLKQRGGQRKLVVLFEGVPKPQIVREIAKSNGNLELVSIQFRIHHFTHSWIETIAELKEIILQNPEIYKDLSSIEVQVGKDCNETTYFQDAVLQSLKGLNLQLIESTSRKSGTTSGLKLKFFYSHGIGNALETFTNNLNGIGEIKFCDLRTKSEKLMSSEGGFPQSPQELVAKIKMWHPINDTWLQIVSSKLQTSLKPEERLNHFYSNLEIEPLSPAFRELYKEDKIPTALQVFFYKRTFDDAEKHLREILRSLGSEIENALDIVNPSVDIRHDLFPTIQRSESLDTADMMPMILGTEGRTFSQFFEIAEPVGSSLPHSYHKACSSKKVKIESRSEYNFFSGIPVALIIVQGDSARMTKDSESLSEVLKYLGFRTIILDEVPSKFESLTDPGITSVLFVALFSSVIAEVRHEKMPLQTLEYKGIPKVLLLNYYRTEAAPSFDTSEMDSKTPDNFEKCVKHWSRNNFPYLQDYIVCFSLSNSDMGTPTFAGTLVQSLKESNRQKRDFTSTLFQVAGRSLGFYESEYFQFGLNRKLQFPDFSGNVAFDPSQLKRVETAVSSKNIEQSIHDKWLLSMMTQIGGNK